MNFIKKLLIKMKIMKLSYEEIHNLKLESIVNHLRQNKLNLYVLLPDELRDKFYKESYIAGGCIYSLYHNDKPKDYDFFLRSQELADSLREFFMDLSGYHGNKISGGTYKDLPLIVTDNAISIGKFQIITKWVGTPEESVSQFDFLHNSFYYCGNKIETLSDFKHLKSKELIYNVNRARDVVGTIIRVNKFVARGMTIKGREMAKILLKLNEVGFSARELETLNDTKLDQHFSS